MEKIGVGIVGCGRIADLHVLGYQKRKDARVVAVCDRNRRRARLKAREWEVKNVYTDYSRFLMDPDFHLVELLVPHHLHASMTIQACEMGKHVSVQKPMAMNVQEADAMIAAAESAEVVLRVYENFVFYPPHVKAKRLMDEGAIGEPQMIRMHVNTGKSETAWKVPMGAWWWRIREEKNSGGLLVFDHGYHLFSLAHYLMGEVERVFAWIDHSPAGKKIPERFVQLDAPATIMFQFKAGLRYGVLDFANTPNMVMDSKYYADDDRVEVIGDKGILFINRCAAKTVDLPPLMLFANGVTKEIPIERYEWEHSFIDCTQHMIEVLLKGEKPILDGETGKKVLQFCLAAHLSSQEKREVRPYEVV